MNDGHGNGGNLELPEDTSDICYACGKNNERNSITTSSFRNLVEETHPMAENDDCISQIPKNTVIIESAIFDRNNERCQRSFETKVYNRCGDTNVRVGRSKKIDPALQFYSGIPLMIIDNTNIKEGRGNGTRCIGISVHLKKDCNVGYSNIDGRFVHTVSVLDLEYMVCEMIVENKNERPKRFKLYPDKYTATITMKINNMQHKVGAKIIQFGVNSNKATTGHKLQGASLNKMVVRSWEYGVPNWIYVVLSRVRSLKGLFICEKLDYTKDFSVEPNLLKEEERLRSLEDKLMKFLNQNSKENDDDIEIKAGNDKENDINKVSDLNKEYLYMKENAIHFINSYVAKKFDNEIFIGLITNYKDGFWKVEYTDGDKEDFDVDDVKKGILLYNSVEKEDICLSSDKEVRKDDDVLVNEFLSMSESAMNYINSYVAKKFDDKLYIGLITNYKGDLWHVEYDDGDEEDFDAIEVQMGIQLYNSLI